MNVIISVIGKDRIGIIRDVSTFLADLNINIVDISQTLMGEYFTMIMRANTEKSTMPIDKLIVALREKGEAVGLDINLRSEEIFDAMHRI
ncbi:MAG: ACT domain-containing protein [Clostridia bacterium]|nr:ACT domain-containing protein [Clostridia bacterium]